MRKVSVRVPASYVRAMEALVEAGEFSSKSQVVRLAIELLLRRMRSRYSAVR